MEGGEGDPKRMKLSPSKTVYLSEGESSESKRLKIGDEKPQVERRVQATEVGDDVHYHMDQFFGEEEFLAWDEEAEEVTVAGVPEALWSSAPLDRVPADPPLSIDELADEVEEQRLLKMGVLEAMEGEKTGFKRLTTRLVGDWRVKARQDLPGAPKQFLSSLDL